MKEKYPALRTIVKIYKITAWFFGFITLISAISAFAKNNNFAESIISIAILFGSGFLVLITIATSEIIKVFLDIEYNTRKLPEE